MTGAELQAFAQVFGAPAAVLFAMLVLLWRHVVEQWAKAPAPATPDGMRRELDALYGRTSRLREEVHKLETRVAVLEDRARRRDQ